MTAFSLAFFTIAVKFSLYTMVENPVWILPIELLHGLTYALPYSAAISYTAHIAPAGAEGLLQGIVGTVLMGIGTCAILCVEYRLLCLERCLICIRYSVVGWPAGSVIGGYLFKHFGSITSLKLLSIITSIFCVIQIIVNQLAVRLFENNDVVEESCGNNPKINANEDNTDNL